MLILKNVCTFINIATTAIILFTKFIPTCVIKYLQLYWIMWKTGKFVMSEQKTQKQIRFEKEAKALQKNIAKRKKQQQELEQAKKNKEKSRGQD